MFITCSSLRADAGCVRHQAAPAAPAAGVCPETNRRRNSDPCVSDAMTQRKRLSGSRQPSSSGTQEDDEDPTFTQPSTSQVQRGLEKFTPAQVDQKTAEVVQYFLVKDQKKIPIRRADLVKHVVKDYRNIYPEIMKKASRTFDQVFGLKLVEIDTKTHVYILINKLETAEDASRINSPTNPKMGLLFAILSVIFMKGGVVREILIWNTLKKLRVDAGLKHEEFGT
ncbi:unnamed protein product [Pleuronectes platessa]|uniref:MAGE domain-containing protein n=1 Tax=Pleuronectes platessa TaxID=8262 RepID=A0A9N7UXC1_PLEPL|nr:unnamed protein product [Pleuronectes platessa]